MNDIKMIEINIDPGKRLYDYLPNVMEMSDDVVCVVGSIYSAYDYIKSPRDCSPKYFAGKRFDEFSCLPDHSMHTPYIKAIVTRAIKDQKWTADEVFHGHFSPIVLNIYYNSKYKGCAGFFLKH